MVQGAGVFGASSGIGKGGPSLGNADEPGLAQTVPRCDAPGPLEPGRRRQLWLPNTVDQDREVSRLVRRPMRAVR
jgi:hypothetical protein